MSGKIAIVVDTNSGISNEMAKELGLYIVPMPFVIDGKDYLEGVNLDGETFYKKLIEDANISTSQPSIGAITEIWNEALKENDYIIHIPMSSSLSKSCETCKMISHEDEYEGKVYIVDNRRISKTLEHCVKEAIGLIKLGKTADDVKDFLEETANDSTIYLMVDTLKYLKKGGRITPSAALLGSLLGIRPVLQIQGGKLDSFAKCRTIKQAKKIMLNQIKEDIKNKFNNEEVEIVFAEAFSKGEIETFKEEVKQELTNIDENIGKLSFSIICHTGPGVIGIGCCKKHI